MVHTLRLDNYYPTPRKLMLGTNSSFGTESIKIERGAGWDGLNLTATWHIPGREEPLRVALLDGDAMDVPPEVTKEAKDGVLVLAGLASGVQRASCNVEYLILEQAGVYGGADAEPTPELAAQVLEAALQAKADAEAAKANADKAQADAEKAQQAAKNAAADAAKAGPYAEDALAAKEAAELARNEAIAAQQAAENAAAAAAASKSAADTLAAEAARAAQAAENSKAAANNAADLAGENATAAQQAAATATAAANDAGQSASDAAASKAAAETAAKSAQDAQAAADKARDEAKAAQKGAEAARDATAKSAAAAKTSEDAAAKSAEDADRDANSIKDSMTQISENKEAVSKLKEDTAALKKRQNVLVGSETGNPASCNDAYSAPLCGLTVYGKSTQDGTPTLDAPVPIVSAGDGGTVVVKVSDGNGKEQTLTLQTPTGLPGIPVTSGGNYTDPSGQQWVCDEVDLERGVKVQRVKVLDINNTSLMLKPSSNSYWYVSRLLSDCSLNNTGTKSYKAVMCQKFPVVSISDETKYSYPIVAPYGHTDKVELRFRAPEALYATIEDFRQTIVGTKVYYPLATPVETPLTPAEIAAYKALTAYAPDTVVQASDGAGVKLEYQRDVNIAIKNLEDAIASMTTT